MDDSDYVYCFSLDAKHGPAIAVKQVAVTGSEYFVLRNEWASFRKHPQGFDLLFESPDEFVGCRAIVVGDETPVFFDVSFRRARDSNANLCGHV